VINVLQAIIINKHINSSISCGENHINVIHKIQTKTHLKLTASV